MSKGDFFIETYSDSIPILSETNHTDYFYLILLNQKKREDLKYLVLMDGYFTSEEVQIKD